MKSSDNKKGFQKILKLASHLGIRVRFGDENKYYIKRLRFSKQKIIQIAVKPEMLLDNSGFRFMTQDLAHELGHYVIASPEQKKRIDYGIPAKRTKNTEYKWDLIDYKATLIEQVILDKLGVRRSTVTQTSDIIKKGTIWWRENAAEYQFYIKQLIDNL